MLVMSQTESYNNRQAIARKNNVVGHRVNAAVRGRFVFQSELPGTLPNTVSYLSSMSPIGPWQPSELKCPQMLLREDRLCTNESGSSRRLRTMLADGFSSRASCWRRADALLRAKVIAGMGKGI